MNVRAIKSAIYRHLINVPGWMTKRKIVVIESDDWGSIRTASKEAYKHFLFKGMHVDSCPYNRNDALECNNDLEQIYDVLHSVKDSFGNHAILTANAVVANPDFKKIKECNFQEYYYEPFIKTLERYPNHDRVYELYKQGIVAKIIKPQFHGREHLNVARWMKALQQEDKYARMAFEWDMFSVHGDIMPAYKNEYMDAFDLDSCEEIPYKLAIIEDGIKLFEKIWGFPSKSFIAPCYIWSEKYEKKLKENGIEYLQGLFVQYEPELLKGTMYKKKYHAQGSRNKYAQIYLQRNCIFEPAFNNNRDCVNDCLTQIKIAFSLRKPAIISSHRVNYIGFINPDNRTNNLYKLNLLLKNILRLWPDVEFFSSDALGDLIAKS